VLRLGIFLAPLAFLPHIVDNFVLPKLILARVLVILLTSLLLVDWARQGAITWKRTPLDLPLLAFVFSAALSTVFAINSNVAIFGTYGRWEGLLTIINYALLFWLAVQFTSGESDSRALTWSLLISGYFIAVAAVLQAAFGLLGGGYFTATGGVIRADVTLANPDFLGIFLATLIPIALAKLLSQRPLLTRVLAANLVVVLVLGLIFTYTRAAWIGALIGTLAVVALRRGRFRIGPVVGLVAFVALFVASIGVVGQIQSSSGVATAVYSRIISIRDIGAGTEGERVRIWQDTLPLVMNRPMLGYGPDTFGLVYPMYETTKAAPGLLWDKPHEEMLGVAAVQGIVGVIAYVWILTTFVRTFWLGRYRRGAVAIFGGWLAYEVGTQFNFSYIPTAVPFWIFAAAAVVTWVPDLKLRSIAKVPRGLALPGLAPTLLALVALSIPAVLLPYLADADYRSALATTSLEKSRAHVAQARTLAPFEATYANEAGDLALNLDASDNPGPGADWPGALEAYSSAARLGSYAPETFRHLAITEDHLGDHAGALAAARRAVELDRYDPDSQALLAKLLRE
jgi:putative inorganic carbon (HCO3(-)) transporter